MQTPTGPTSVRTLPHRSLAAAPPARERVVRKATIPFLVFHLVPLFVILTGVTTAAVVLAVVSYSVRLFLITAVYHRYLSHRSFSMGRIAQFVLVFGAGTAVQKGPLWWAANHRAHHRYTDTARDPHSPQRGFWWSHVGWILSDQHFATDPDDIADLTKYPELRWLNKHDWVAPWMLGVASYLIAGWSGLVVGFFVSTILLWHATFAINSVAHLRGFRRYATNDSSRNHPVLAVVTFGEGWHNNHHHQPTSARQGIRWWELDITYRILQVLRLLHVVRDLRRPSDRQVAARELRSGIPDLGLMRYHLARAAGLADSTSVAGQWQRTLATAEGDLVALGRRSSRPVVERIGLRQSSNSGEAAGGDPS